MLKILFFLGIPAIVLNLFFLNTTVVDGRDFTKLMPESYREFASVSEYVNQQKIKVFQEMPSNAQLSDKMQILNQRLMVDEVFLKAQDKYLVSFAKEFKSIGGSTLAKTIDFGPIAEYVTQLEITKAPGQFGKLVSSTSEGFLETKLIYSPFERTILNNAVGMASGKTIYLGGDPYSPIQTAKGFWSIMPYNLANSGHMIFHELGHIFNNMKATHGRDCIFCGSILNSGNNAYGVRKAYSLDELNQAIKGARVGSTQSGLDDKMTKANLERAVSMSYDIQANVLALGKNLSTSNILNTKDLSLSQLQYLRLSGTEGVIVGSKDIVIHMPNVSPSATIAEKLSAAKDYIARLNNTAINARERALEIHKQYSTPEEVQKRFNEEWYTAFEYQQKTGLDFSKRINTASIVDPIPTMHSGNNNLSIESDFVSQEKTYIADSMEDLKSEIVKQGLKVETSSESIAAKKYNIPDTVIVTGAKPGISLSVTGETLNGLVRDTGKIRVSISDSLPAFSTDAKGLTINSVILGGKKIVAPNITFNMLAKNIVAETITPKAPPVVTNKVAETRVPTKIQTANATLAKGAGVLVLAQVTAAIQGVADSLNKNMGNPAEQQRILNQASATLNHTAFDTAVFTVKFAVESGAMIAVLAYVGVPASLAVSTTGIVLTTSEIIIPMSAALLTDPNLGKNLLSAINGDGSALASTIGVIKTDYNNAKDNLTNANNWTTGAGVLNDLFGFAQDRYEAGKEHIKDLINASKTTASNSLVKTVVSSAAKTAAVSSKKNEIKKNTEKNNPDAKFSAEELKNIFKDADQYIKAANKYLNDVDGNPNKPMLSKNGLNIQFTMPVAPSTEKAKQAAVNSGIVVPANVNLMNFFSPTGADSNKRTPFISTDSGRIFAYDTGLEIVNNAVTPEYNDDGTLKSFKVRFSTGLTAEYPPFITPQKLDAGLTNWTSPNRVTVKPDLNFQLGVGVLLVTACSKNMPSTNFSQDLTQLSINNIIDEAIKNPTANVVCTRSAGPSTVASSTCNCSSSSSPSIVNASVCSAQPAAIRSGFALDDVSNIFAAIGQ